MEIITQKIGGTIYRKLYHSSPPRREKELTIFIALLLLILIQFAVVEARKEIRS